MHEIATLNLSKMYFLKNAKKTSKPNNCDLNRNRIKPVNTRSKEKYGK